MENSTVTLTNGTKGLALLRANVALFTGKTSNHLIPTLETTQALAELVGEDNVEQLVADLEDAFNVFADAGCEMILALMDANAKSRSEN